MKIEKEKTEKIVLGTIIAVIIIVVMFYLVFGPNIKRMSTLRADIRKEKTRVEEAEREIADLGRLKSNLKKLKGEIKEYEGELPGATDEWLLGILNQIAERTGVDFDKRERRGYTMQAGEYRLLELGLELRTDYHKLGRFINQLELSSRFINVWNLEIVGSKDDIKRHNVSLTVGAFVPVPEEKE